MSKAIIGLGLICLLFFHVRSNLREIKRVKSYRRFKAKFG